MEDISIRTSNLKKYYKRKSVVKAPDDVSLKSKRTEL